MFMDEHRTGKLANEINNSLNMESISDVFEQI